MNVRHQFLLSLLAASLLPQLGGAQELPTETRQRIGRFFEQLIPQALRSKKDKKAKTFNPSVTKPLVTEISAPYTPTNGLQNRHIAMWQSHGYYYEQKLTRWEWQRARIFQTVEDLYTQSYEHAPSMQIEKGGVMFGSTKEGLIFALEAKTGRLLWKHKIGNSLINTVVPLSGQEVLFTATGGEVVFLKIKE